MARCSLYAGCITLALAGLAVSAFAQGSTQDPNSWSPVANESNKPVVVELATLPAPIGSNFPTAGEFWVAQAPEEGESIGTATKMVPGKTFTLKKKTKYMFYFQTNSASLACQTFRLGDHTVILFKCPALKVTGTDASDLMGTVAGALGNTKDMIVVGTNCKGKVSDCPLVINYSGFRNTSSPEPFITIN